MEDPGWRRSHRRRFSDAFRRYPPPFPWRICEKGLVPAQPDGWPKLQITRYLAYLPVNGGIARPNAPSDTRRIGTDAIHPCWTLAIRGRQLPSPVLRHSRKRLHPGGCISCQLRILTLAMRTEPSARMRRSAGPRSPFCCIAVSLRHLGQYGEEFVFAGCSCRVLGRNVHIQHEDSGLVTGVSMGVPPGTPNHLR